MYSEELLLSVENDRLRAQLADCQQRALDLEVRMKITARSSIEANKRVEKLEAALRWLAVEGQDETNYKACFEECRDVARRALAANDESEDTNELR